MRNNPKDISCQEAAPPSFKQILAQRCKEAIEYIGGPKHCARTLTYNGCRISYQALQQWRKVPEKYLDIIAALCDKPREYFRPDLKKPAPVTKLANNYIQGLVRGSFAALQAERVVRRRFKLSRTFAREECFKRRIAIYVASMAIDDVQVLSIAAHFAVSHTAVNKAKAEIENKRDHNRWLDNTLDELCIEVARNWGQYGF